MFNADQSGGRCQVNTTGLSEYIDQTKKREPLLIPL